VVYLFASLDKENREDEEEINERLALDESDKIKKWTKKNQKGIKKWTGKLTDEQKSLVASFHGRFESTSQFWLAYKREYQQQLREVFARPQRDVVFEERLYELIVNPEKFRSQPFQTAMDVNAQASTDYIIELMALLSDKQLERVVKEIEEFRQDTISIQK
jgi:predicted mannosyl-3-phosphoglycerate phosphatase (HAD superfamily)